MRLFSFAFCLVAATLVQVSIAKVYPECSTDTVLNRQSFYPISSGTTEFVETPQIFLFYMSDSETGLKLTTNQVKLQCVGYEIYLAAVSHSCEEPTSSGADKPYRILLQANNIEDSTEMHSWDLDDVSGGSVESLIYRVKYDAVWSIYVVNKYAVSQCGLSVELAVHIVDHKNHSDTYAQVHPTLVPALVDLNPLTISSASTVGGWLSTSSLTTYLVFKMRGGFDTLGVARVRPAYASDTPVPSTITPVSSTGNGTTAAPPPLDDDSGELDWSILALSNDSLTSHGFNLAGDTAEYGLYAHRFDAAGVYDIQFQRSSSSDALTDTTWQSLGSIVVFAENPAFFVVTSGAGAEGQLMLNQKTTIRFQGTGLDSSSGAGGDRVKFVDEATQTCAESSSASGGVATGYVDFEAGTSSTNATRVTWTFTLTHSGFYRVCYNPYGTTLWHQVLSYAEIPHLNPHTQPPGGTYPVPTNAITKTDCEVTPTEYVVAMTTIPDYIIVSTNSPTYSFATTKNLAGLLCLDPETIMIIELVHENHDTTHNLEAYINIDCTKTEGACSSDERKVYLLWAWGQNSAQFTDLGIMGIANAESDGEYVVASEESEQFTLPQGGDQVFVFLLVIFLFLAVIAICTFMFMRKHCTPPGKASDSQAAPAPGVGQVGRRVDPSSIENGDGSGGVIPQQVSKYSRNDSDREGFEMMSN